MEIDLNALERPMRYKLLTSLVVPRPIALVTTMSEGGVINAAPFSYFNVLGEDPPILIISADAHPSGKMKDTVHNILTKKQFVVNLVDEGIAEQMRVCRHRAHRIERNRFSRIQHHAVATCRATAHH
jgi:flavin reductase (DIM6/NTAB) family NADH-FMN oxidoreductase RutF